LFVKAPAPTVIYTLSLHDALPISVYFIFQHAEETPPGGALEIIKSGALNEVEAFFGMHVAPSHPVGHVGVTFDNPASTASDRFRSEEHTSELQSRENLVCRLLLEK